jgi:hypothetical protein
MLVALHIDPKNWAKLLGVWVAPEGSDGFPECFYPAPAEGFDAGHGRMEVKGAVVPWPEFFGRLAESSPYSAYWSVREEADGVALDELYERLALEVADSAAALAAQPAPAAGYSIVVPGVNDPTTSEVLSLAVGGPSTRLSVKERLSTLCHFFADDEQLVLVGRAGIDDVDLALAWGLAYRGDRSLALVLPADQASPTMIRVPWLVPPVRVFTFTNDGVVAEPPPLSQAESIASFAGRTSIVEHPSTLGATADWVAPVLEWTATAPGLNRDERSSYVTWQVGGRRVLTMTPSAKRLTVVAGVQSTKPENWPPVERFVLTGPAEGHVCHEIIAAAATAAARRLRGDDAANRENRFQAGLDHAKLGLAGEWRREFPAWRPSSSSAARIDFLAKDPQGRVHIVETKIGADTMLILQGLDYWLWCRANAGRVCEALDATSTLAPMIHFVVAPDKPGGEPISPYTAAQAEALSGTVPWRFSIVADADHPMQVTTLKERQVPEPHRRIGNVTQRWAVRLQQDLTAGAAAAGSTLRRGHSYLKPAEALVPGALAAYRQLQTRGLLHGYSLHVRSSQAFALNLLAPLSPAAWSEIARHLLGDPHAEVTEPAEFEYTDPHDALGEATEASPYATQVDCLVRARTAGRTHGLLIEVKLAEDAFSTCSAYRSARNPRRSICSRPGPFGNDPVGCFQLANHDREHRRRYDEALGAPLGEPASFGCWFRDGANQVMRNAALAKAMIARGDLDSASVVLMAPEQHGAIWEQWHRHLRYLSVFDGVGFGQLPASQVAALHEPDEARLLCQRYQFPLDVLDIRLAQHLIDAHFPNGGAHVRLAGDGTVDFAEALARFPVVETTADEIVFETPYPAGPLLHRIPRQAWTSQNPIVVAQPDGNGSRAFLTDLSALRPAPEERSLGTATAELRDETPALAAALRTRAPYWTAPVPPVDAWR